MMRILIKNQKDGPRFLWFAVPLCLIKTKLAAKIICSNDKIDMDPAELHQRIKHAYKKLKRYTKEHGHFYLVEVHEKDGGVVKIRI